MNRETIANIIADALGFGGMPERAALRLYGSADIYAAADAVIAAVEAESAEHDKAAVERCLRLIRMRRAKFKAISSRATASLLERLLRREFGLEPASDSDATGDSTE